MTETSTEAAWRRRNALNDELRKVSAVFSVFYSSFIEAHPDDIEKLTDLTASEMLGMAEVVYDGLHTLYDVLNAPEAA